MSVPDKGAGPQVTQDVLYQIAATHLITAATIIAVNSDGTVNLVWFGPATPATVANNVQFRGAGLDGGGVAGPSDGKWTYPQFQ